MTPAFVHTTTADLVQSLRNRPALRCTSFFDTVGLTPRIRNGATLQANPSQIYNAPVFEPVVNVPALASFLIIATVFGFLMLRINAVDRAAVRRKDALDTLRTIKSRELSSVGEDRPDPALVQQSLDDYEKALREEENLRTVIPGVRIVAPNGPASNSKEEVAAAKQFLGIDLQPTSVDPPSKEQGGRQGLPGGAIAILAVVALSQLALLYMLSFDPMVTGQLSSW